MTPSTRYRLAALFAMAGPALVSIVAACDEVAPATTTDCAPGEAKCGSICVVLRVDPQNCGACGVACGSTQACSGGACASLCHQDEQTCTTDRGGVCTNVGTDNANCGACGNRCPPLTMCSAGVCTSSCVTGQTTCGLDGGAPYCAKLDTDNANCGACGKACAILEDCVAGQCTAACLVSQTKCTPDGGVQPDGAPAVPFCADTKNDNLNCGACGNQCPLNKPLCSVGTCVEAG